MQNMKTDDNGRPTVVSSDAVSKAKASFPPKCPQCAASVKDLEKHLRKAHPKWKVHKKRKLKKQPKLTTPKWADAGEFKRGLFVQGGLGSGK